MSAGAPSGYFDLLENLQKWVIWNFCPSLGASFNPLAHRRNTASGSLLVLL